jgi:hypothetical protein
MSTALRVTAGCLGVFLFVCSAAGAPLKGDFRRETGVVLTGPAGLDLIEQCWPFEFPTKQWTPDPMDIATVDAALMPALTSALKTLHDASNPSDYFRQYSGGFYEGDHIVYIRGFHRSYLDALPSGSTRNSWRVEAVPAGPGHTRFWCAYWVKETKYLVPTRSMGDPSMGVGFFGMPTSSISIAQAAPGTVGPIQLTIPEGFEFAKSGRQNNADVSAWIKGTGLTKTVLQVSVVDMASPADSATPQQLAQGAEKYLRQFLKGVARRRTDYARSPIRHLSLAGAPAASATWTGKFDGLPTVGVMYCIIIHKRYIVSFHTQDSGNAPTPAMREAMKSFEAAKAVPQ